MKVVRSRLTLQMLQRPPEIFAGVMPLKRRIYSQRLYFRRCRKIDGVVLRSLMLKNRDYLEKWIQPQPQAVTLKCVSELILEDQFLARKGQRLDLAIFKISEESMIGRIALHSVDFGIQRSAAVSYWIDEEETCKGYGTEALATITSFAFEEAGLHRVWLKIAKGNGASLAVANKLGFIQEGINRKCLFIDGEWKDAEVLSMLEDEYDNLADNWLARGYLGVLSD